MPSEYRNGEKYTPLVAESIEIHNGGNPEIQKRLSGDQLNQKKQYDLELHIADLEKQRCAAAARLEDFDRKWNYRRKFLSQELQQIVQEKASAEMELETLSHAGSEWHPPLPGPACLSWIEGNVFQTICTLIIVLNIIVMFLEMSRTGVNGGTAVLYATLDNVFLLWYVFELTLKAILFQRQLLIGKISKVWFNWLDLSIVVCGIAEQWIVPVLHIHGKNDQRTVSPTYFRMLRLLRLVRIARIAKAVYVFVQLDLSWVEGQFFQSLIMGVIFVNAIVMGLEVDVNWSGWYWIEQIFLVIYTFELAVKIKGLGMGFFGGSCSNAGFNIMDFVIVAGGMLDQWLLPLIGLFQKLAFGIHQQSDSNDGAFFKLLRMMRLLRALRLIRLLRTIKPLYDLMAGIVEAMQGVGWVLLLTMVILYAFAVTFTNLIGHGLIYGGGDDDVPDGAKKAFGSVLTSMFNLFKLMNGDQDVVEPILDSSFVKVAFAGFMIIANWMVLALLTSVVSDRMISTTQRHEKEEHDKEAREAYSQSVARLRGCLAATGAYGTISWPEFEAMLQDDLLVYELTDASGLSATDLEELFQFTARDGKVDSEEYLVKLLEHGSSITERSMFRMERYIHSVEQRMERRMETMMGVLGPESSSSRSLSLGSHWDEHRKLFSKITRRRLDEQCKGYGQKITKVWL